MLVKTINAKVSLSTTGTELSRYEVAVGAGVAGVVGVVTAPIWGPPVAAVAAIIKGSSFAAWIATAVGGAVANGVKA